METGPMPSRKCGQGNNNFGTESIDETWDLLNIYADGEASPEEIAQVEELLKSDASFGRQLSFVKTTSAAMRLFDELDPPSSLRSAILAATSQRVTFVGRLIGLRDDIRRLLAPRYSLSIAGLAAAGLLAFAFIRHDSQHLVKIGHTQYVITKNTAGPIAGQQDEPRVSIAENLGPQIDLHGSRDSHVAGTNRSQLTIERIRRASVVIPPSRKIAAILPKTLTTRPKSALSHHDDGGVTVVNAAYRPNMDDQFERNPGNVAVRDNQPVDIPGDDVHIADTETPPQIASAHSVPATVAASPTSQNDGPHIIVAKLTALPPDPNQVLTKADMARNHAMLTSGYDRSTLRSMERKETSISILRGTF